MTAADSSARPVQATAPRRLPVGPLAPAIGWSTAPTLGHASGQSYLGRIVVEIFEDGGGNVAFMGVDQPLVKRAIATLQEASSLPVAPAPWPAEPIMGRRPSDGAYQGRVIVELWEVTAHVATSDGDTPADDLRQSAIQALQSFSIS